jgi:hypothetical protein
MSASIALPVLEGWLETYIAAGEGVPRPKGRVSARGLVELPIPTQLAVAITLRWARTDGVCPSHR